MPDAQALSMIQQLGTTGFSLLVLWWIYKDFSQRLAFKDNDYAGRIAKMELYIRDLEKQVRTEITVQLAASTSALRDNAKIMERVIDRINK